MGGGTVPGNFWARQRRAARVSTMVEVVVGAGAWIDTIFNMVVGPWLARDADDVGGVSGHEGAARAKFEVTR